MKFRYVAQCFEKIEGLASRNAITQELALLLASASPSQAAIIAYLSLGELNAPYVGTQFNIAEKSLIKAIAKATRTSQDEVAKKMKSLGDLGLVIFDLLGENSKHDELTITQLYHALKKIHDISGGGSQAEKEEALLDLLLSLDGLSAKYVVRIIMGKLRLGFSDMTLLDAFSWMQTGDKSLREALEEAYNTSADIGLIIETLKEKGLEGIKKMAIKPGIPVRLAAAERMASAEQIIKKLGSCIAEPKLDGFRVQVHVDKRTKRPKIHFFSRNLKDMHGMFPDLERSIAKLPVETFIGEGEAIAYNIETGVFLPFQETVKRKRKHGIDAAAQDIPLKLYLFDALYVDGEPLIDKAFTTRRGELRRIVEKLDKDTSEEVFLIEEKKFSEPDALDEYFNQCISSGLEGLVLKKPDAPYTAGKRNFNWIKFKRKESGQLDDTIDCIILGYYAGHGKRASFGIGAFLVGIKNEKSEMIQTVAKIGTGLSDQEWKDLKKQCDDLRVAKKPVDVECAKDLYPDVWVEPRVVCAIRADEITRSPLHTAGKGEKELGYALRFPRMMGYRPDKSPEEATSLHELKELFKLQFEGKTKKSRRE